MTAGATIAIGDIHGCSQKLAALLLWVIRTGKFEGAKFVFLGDYIDRGPKSKEVVEKLMALQRELPESVVCLRGNHEQMLLNAIAADRSDRDLMTWIGNGGEQTLLSYDCEDPSDLPEEHLHWFRSLPLTTHDAMRFFVHAGVRPDIPLEQQSEDDLLWIREPFLSSDKRFGLLVVHGHTVVKAADLRKNRLNLDTGACFGGRLTAAIFEDDESPLMFINDRGEMSWPT